MKVFKVETESQRAKGVKVIAVAATAFLCVSLAGCTAKTSPSTTIPTSNLSRGAQIAQIPPEALKNALNAFSKAKSTGQDLAQGPCLGVIAPDWVLDIAHNPRLAVDDQPQNQCADFQDGKAQHFVEMDKDGQIIQAR